MNYKSLAGLLLTLGLAGCKSQNTRLVSNTFIDSIIKNYTPPAFARANDSAIRFWKDRIRPEQPGIVSESKYAASLSQRFHLFGDIRDIQVADSVMRKIDMDFNHREAQADLTLVSYSIQQHRFSEASEWLEKATQTGLKKYDFLITSFDVDFELGKYFQASNALKELKSSPDYNYYFRRSKMDHLNGALDSALQSIQQAAELEKNSPMLQQIALSNAGDLCVHAGEFGQAAELFKKCVQMNSADFHSLMGLGWIAMAHDKNDSLAGKIFSFVRTRSKSPEAIYKLYQVAQFRRDTSLELKYAKEFATIVTGPAYGKMYNKYLIELYTGIMNEPALAEKISKDELNNRATPQTSAWYAWSLFCNNKKTTALEYYTKNVSGRSLEAMELFWMGKMMHGMNKGFNAQAYLKAASVNKFDLSPAMQYELEKSLD
jgi:tetratricopeptide (TPR) repeat protein